MSEPVKIRVVLPYHLQTIAQVEGEAEVLVSGAVTAGSVLDALEAAHPKLRGAIRDHGTKKRRDFVRFFVCGEDWSHQPTDAALPQPVAAGEEPFLVVGAIAGG
jgi:hypothetical protein